MNIGFFSWGCISIRVLFDTSGGFELLDVDSVLLEVDSVLLDVDSVLLEVDSVLLDVGADVLSVGQGIYPHLSSWIMWEKKETYSTQNDKKDETSLICYEIHDLLICYLPKIIIWIKKVMW